MSSSGHAHRFSFILMLAGLIIAIATPSAAVITFTNITDDIPGIFYGATEWGDYDRDGDLDLLLSGDLTTRIYRCMGDYFTNSGIVLPDLDFACAAWGDYDNDGDLDILLQGWDGAENYVGFVFRNDGALGFTDINAGILGVAGGAATWADYDNDGDLDILITGSQDDPLPNTYLYRNDGAGVFALVEKGIVPMFGSSAAWGDYDNDGDLDLALSGIKLDPGWVYRTLIYRNDGAGPAWPVVAELVGAYSGAIAWADYDCDEDLDLIVAGFSGPGERATHLYRNDGEDAFTDAAVGFVPLGHASVSWGDYDNDGDPDLLLCGTDSALDRMIFLFANDGVGGLDEVATPLYELAEGTLEWGDFEADGDLDIVQSGRSDYAQIQTAVWRSDGATPNTAPSTPTFLSSVIEGDQVVLNWSPATDAQTPAACLTYNLRIGTSTGGSQIMAPMARETGRRYIVDLGNVQEQTRWAIDVRAVQYYWTVQAIDGAFAGSAFATERTIPLAAVEGSDAGTAARITSVVPNPSDRTTGITIALDVAAQVRLVVYDVAGRRVRVLLDGSMSPGARRVEWDGTSDQGLPMGSGLYLCRLDAGSVTATRSILRID